MLTRIMHIVRFNDESGSTHWGIERDDGHAIEIHDTHGLLSGRRERDVNIRELLASGRAFEKTNRTIRIAKLLAPVTPINILCAGRNYLPAGQTEARQPLELFMKPITALQHPNEPVYLTPIAGDDREPDLDLEGELAAYIGSELRCADPEQAMQAVVGLTIAGDATERRWQLPGPPLWMRGKGFDTFCPLGPALVTDQELLDSVARSPGPVLRTFRNGELIRESTTSQMIRSLPELLAEISHAVTIPADTLVLTGGPTPVPKYRETTPTLRDGDVIEMTIAGIGTLTNTIRKRVCG
jgi:2-keto-4-pentenoate hydratase/2-oxohepta-3-ene-1,7-dioic acid hydratase in catechol pathway